MRNRFIVVALLACLLMPSVAEAKQVKVKRVAHGVIFRSVRKYHPRLRVKTFPVAVEDGQVVVYADPADVPAQLASAE